MFYLGHNLEDLKSKLDNENYKLLYCNICDNVFWLRSNNSFLILNHNVPLKFVKTTLTCNEIIIKNIIE